MTRGEQKSMKMTRARRRGTTSTFAQKLRTLLKTDDKHRVKHGRFTASFRASWFKARSVTKRSVKGVGFERFAQSVLVSLRRTWCVFFCGCSVLNALRQDLLPAAATQSCTDRSSQQCLPCHLVFIDKNHTGIITKITGMVNRTAGSLFSGNDTQRGSTA